MTAALATAIAALCALCTFVAAFAGEHVQAVWFGIAAISFALVSLRAQ